MNWKIASAVTTLFIGSVLLIGQKSDDTNPAVPCQRPLTYQIADLDPRFDTDKKTIRKIMRKVEGLWKTALNKDVLKYSKSGTVKIDLVYSNSQQRTNEEQRMAKRIERTKLQIMSLKVDIENLRKSYQHKKESYQQTSDTYHKTVNRLNSQIVLWNEQGVDLNEKTKEIKKMKQKVQNLKSIGDRKHKNAQFMRSRINNKIERLNTLVERSKKIASKYNNKFSQSHRFNQGKFIKENNKQRVEIYEFGNKAELKTVLTHETGHALGIKHVDNSKSVMYYLMGEQNIFDLKLTNEDKTALQNICK